MASWLQKRMVVILSRICIGSEAERETAVLICGSIGLRDNFYGFVWKKLVPIIGIILFMFEGLVGYAKHRAFIA